MSKDFIACPELLEDHKDLRDHLSWGSRGVDGTQEVVRNKISELSDCHIFNILCTQGQISEMYREAFLFELFWRLRERQEVSGWQEG